MPSGFSIDLSGKTVIISGGNKGIGAAISTQYAEAGANVAILYNSGEASANELSAKLREVHGAKVSAYQCDTTSVARLGEISGQIVKDFGSYEIVVCNAGVCVHESAVDTTEESLDWVLGVNFKGVFFLATTAAKYWIQSKQAGSIVINSSMSGKIINIPQRQAVYNASKAGVTHLAKALAVEWAEHQIRVNVVSPGYVATEMTTLGDQEVQKIWLDRTPMKRMATPQEIAKTILFLSSEHSSYTTGSEVLVDGGYSTL